MPDSPVPLTWLGPAFLGPTTVDMVVLHPERGIAVVEYAPHWSEDALLHLQQRLAQGRFVARFGGLPPLVHVAVQQADMVRLPDIVLAALGDAQPLSLSGGDWAGAARAILQTPVQSAGARPGVSLWSKHLLLIVSVAGFAVGGFIGCFLIPEPVKAPVPIQQAAPAPEPPVAAVEPPPAPELVPPLPAPPLEVAPPAAHVEEAPPPAPTPAPARVPDEALISPLMRRGNALLAQGDKAGARMFFERAARESSVEAALAAGRASEPDADAAEAWYRRAREMADQQKR